MNEYTEECPECSTAICYGVFIEDGSIGEWCPNCSKSLQKMEKDQKIPLRQMLLVFFARLLRHPEYGGYISPSGHHQNSANLL